MAWQQLVKPNLSIVGKVGWCLEYARKVYGAPAVEPTAWDGWQRAKFKHANQSFPPVDVPVWFTFFQGGVNYGHVAVRLSNGQIYSSPWKAGTTHAVLGSIAELERIYGAKFVGWTEDISNVRVVANKEEGKTVIKTEDLDALRILFSEVQGVNAEDVHIHGKYDDLLRKTFVGLEFAPVIRNMYFNKESTAYRARKVTDRDGVKYLYKGFLRREPSEQEIKNMSGKDWPDLIHTIVGSDEYKAVLAGGGTKPVTKEQVIAYVQSNLK